MFFPLAVLIEQLYGAVVSVQLSTPFLRNSTLVTPILSEAVACTEIFVPRGTLLPFEGLVIVTVGLMVSPLGVGVLVGINVGVGVFVGTATVGVGVFTAAPPVYVMYTAYALVPIGSDGDPNGFGQVPKVVGIFHAERPEV